MKKLLGVIGFLALAAALLPAQGRADLRGSFAPLTSQDGWVTGAEQSAHRPVDAEGLMVFPAETSGPRLVELWFAMSTRSLIPGREGVRSIYIHITAQQFPYFTPLLHDPSANISYFDPAWSSDGRFLAYIQANHDGTGQSLFVQEYFVNDDFEAIHGGSYPVGEGAESAVGSPILVATGNVRHPHWSPAGHTLAFDSNVAGTFDIYTSDIDVDAGTAGTPIRRTFDNVKAETDAAWGPSLGAGGGGHLIAYSTNKFGPRILEIIDLDLSSGDPNYTKLAERNFAFVSHNNPSWSSDGNTLFYDAVSNEDNSSLTAIWTLDLTTQGKCEIEMDPIHASADPDVSGIVNFTNEGQPYNYYNFTSQAGGIGVQIWKGNALNSCLLPLAMGVATVPPTFDIADSSAFATGSFVTVMNFPPETQAAGYRCRSTNAGLIDGVRLRNADFANIPSPILMGVPTPASGGVGGTACFDSTAPGPDPNRIRCNWRFRDVIRRIVDLGLVDVVVPMKMTAYSNQVGRRFQGFSYLFLTDSNASPAASIISSSPNPFNPVTKIRFSVSKPGNYALRLYNVQGALIRTVASRHFDAGTHEATWDGRLGNGAMAASGVYYAKLSGAAKKFDSESAKLVLTK